MSEESNDWKISQYRKMGCSLKQAQRLAETPIDVARARKLIKDGCSPELMERILDESSVWDEIGYHQSNADKAQMRTGRQDTE